MTLQQLRCFAVAAKELHYTKAAARLHISQPSLSYSISELEKELNVALFERKENKTCLTRYAEELLPYVQVALDKVDAIQIKAYELADPSVGAINLGNIYSISFDFVPKVLEAFYTNKENGNVTVSFFQGVNKVLVDKLMEGSLDLILSGKSDDGNLHSAYLFTQELKFVAPEDHRLANRAEVTLEDVWDEGLISLGENSNISNHIARCFRSRGLEAKFVLSVAECSAMGAFISSRMGTAIAPVVPSFHSNSVRVIPFAEEDKKLLGRDIHLQWVKDRYLSPAVRRFRDFILREFKANRES